MTSMNGIANDLDHNNSNNHNTDKWISDTTTASFKHDVLDKSKQCPVIVDFWAPWCEPCKQLGPIIEKIVNEQKGRLYLAKMDIDKHPAIAGQLGISSIPAVIAFIDGKPVDAFMGNIPESEIRSFINRHLPDSQSTDYQEALKSAQELMAQGEFIKALSFFSDIVQQEADNITAIIGLASCLLEVGQVEKAKAILEAAPANKKNDPEFTAVLARITLKESTQELGDSLALQQQIDENPKNYQARFDLALVLNAQQNHTKAAELLLDLISEDRNWQEEKAKKQLLQLFEVWGPTNPVTLSARRKLSSLLFA